MVRTTLVALAGSDCERVRDGFLAQPANALSSLAYVAAGAWVVDRAGRARELDMAVFGVALGSVGVGSFFFHGPQWPGAATLHDLSIGAAVIAGAVPLGVVALRPHRSSPDPARPGTRDRSRRRGLGAFAAACLVSAVALYLPSRTGGPWCRPDSLAQGHAAWHVLSAMALAAGALLVLETRRAHMPAA